MMGLDTMIFKVDMPSYFGNENGKNLLLKVFVFLVFMNFLLLSFNVFSCVQVNDFQWKEIRKNKISGYYKSPFSEDCFYLYLEKQDKKDLLKLNNSHLMKRNIHNEDYQYLFFNLEEDNKKNFYFLKYTIHTKKDKIQKKRRNYKYLLRYEQDLFFYHELYHLHPTMFYSYDNRIKEFRSDISALLHLTMEHKLNKEELYLLSKDLYEYRREESMYSNSHYNEMKWNIWLLKLQNKKEKINYNSMNEIINSLIHI